MPTVDTHPMSPPQLQPQRAKSASAAQAGVVR
jgi:hypothetical protein